MALQVTDEEHAYNACMRRAKCHACVCRSHLSQSLALASSSGNGGCLCDGLGVTGGSGLQCAGCVCESGCGLGLCCYLGACKICIADASGRMAVPYLGNRCCGSLGVAGSQGGCDGLCCRGCSAAAALEETSDVGGGG